MRTFLFFLVFTSSLLASGQEEEIRLKQRAIFIYNFARQVVWPNDAELEQFDIGVLGEDPVRVELVKMIRQGRTIRGRPMRVRQVSRLADVEKYQLVYLHKNYNFQIGEVLQAAHDQQVLVISENYGFNESMINIIETTDGFQFELNETRLNIEGFIVNNGLRRASISTAERWQELYQQSSVSLEEARTLSSEQQAELDKQEAVIQNLNKRINDQLTLLDDRNVQVEELEVKIGQQNKDLDELMRRVEAQRLTYEQRVLEQQQQEQAFATEMAKRQEEIIVLDQTLDQQKLEIIQQEEELEEQNRQLRLQRQELDAQKWFTILFAILASLSVLTIFFFWRSYQIKRKANLVLAQKNAAIQIQAREIDQKSKEMEQFAYIASHDLQEPLNTIAGSLSLIDNKQLDDVGNYSVNFIDEAIQRMRKMIQGLLEHSKLGVDVAFQSVEVNQVLENVHTNLRQLILDKKAKVTWDSLPAVQGHEVELTLLFQNLINNALKFTKPGDIPEVHVGVKSQEEGAEAYWQFEVRDNGIGIDVAHQKKIFGFFQRLNSKAAYEGSGIGLAHCKKIVELHGGRIWVVSKIGEGSTFCFTIRKAG